MKIIAMYLPQFHQTEENDKWWGDGYTEWTAVRGAEPLFEGHIQPRIPLGQNYYDLLEKSTMEWQADLMGRYGIYGMCMYHYWFNGKKVLEKPAENLLQWKDIRMPFCFSWANETWARSWSKIEGNNAWAEQYEKGKAVRESGILLKQEYGGYEDWKRHFDYLLPFFRDDRYIKIDDKPIFIIYKPMLIECAGDMIDSWRKLALDHGLPGIYVIGTNVESSEAFDAVYQQEPQHTIMRFYRDNHGKQGIDNVIDYKELNALIKEKYIENRGKTFLGTVTKYDDTPRRGRKGTIFENASAETFEDTLKTTLRRSKELGNEFVFVNAWNEWGEGMYLEPDTADKYAYLEAVRRALDTYDKTGDGVVNNIYAKKTEALYRTVMRYQSYWKTFEKWMVLKQRNYGLALYFKRSHMSRIAIYGMGMMAEHLVEELKQDKDVSVAYGIDRNHSSSIRSFPVPVYGPEDKLPQVDLIVVTVGYEYEKIRNQLKTCVSCTIKSLEGILDEMEEESDVE